MRTPAWLALAVLGGVASALGQPQTEGTFTYTLRYQVAMPTGPTSAPWQSATLSALNTGAVGNGQGALFTLFLSMSNSPETYDPACAPDPCCEICVPGSPQHWTPGQPPGTSGSGVLAGFWNGDIDLRGDNGAATANGTWSDRTTFYATNVNRRTRIWTTGQLNGDIAPGGASLTNIQPAQFAPSPDDLIHVNNAVCWQGLWMPGSYEPRTVNWRALLGSLGFLSQVGIRDDNGYPFVVAKNVATLFGPAVNIQVVPGPSGLAILGLGGLFGSRRRSGGAP